MSIFFKRGFKWTNRRIGFLFLAVLILVPLLLTFWINNYISLTNFSPLEADSHILEDHLAQRSWIFSLLKLGGELPLYKVEPSFEKVSPAITQTFQIGNKTVVNTVPYDSLTCLSQKFINTNQKDLSTIKWTDCKFQKNFAWGYVTGDDRPKINISLGLLGLTFIFFSAFVLSAGFVLLLLNVFKSFFDLIKIFQEQTNIQQARDQ